MAKTALISVNNKDKLPYLVQSLQKLLWQVFTTQETHDFLEQGQIFTTNLLAFVNTLQCQLSQARRLTASKLVDMAVRSKVEQLCFPVIDLVYVDVDVCIEPQRNGFRRSLHIEGLELTGFGLLRSAKAGNKFFLCQPKQIEPVLQVLSDPVPDEFCQLRLKSSLFGSTRRVFNEQVHGTPKMPLFGV
jgi:AICAR transformylase/IMP cyclohydrolase PurH